MRSIKAFFFHSQIHWQSYFRGKALRNNSFCLQLQRKFPPSDVFLPERGQTLFFLLFFFSAVSYLDGNSFLLQSGTHESHAASPLSPSLILGFKNTSCQSFCFDFPVGKFCFCPSEGNVHSAKTNLDQSAGKRGRRFFFLLRSDKCDVSLKSNPEVLFLTCFVETWAGHVIFVLWFLRL